MLQKERKKVHLLLFRGSPPTIFIELSLGPGDKNDHQKLYLAYLDYYLLRSWKIYCIRIENIHNSREEWEIITMFTSFECVSTRI